MRYVYFFNLNKRYLQLKSEVHNRVRFCALAFPVLFPKTPKGRYGYTTERQVAISPVKYLNARRHSRPM